MTTRLFRFVDYVTNSDPDGEQTWRAVCVSGDEKECGAKSPELGGEEAANDWMVEHRAESGHSRIERGYTEYAIVRPRT